MASKYEDTLKQLAVEPDETRRLEMAANIDTDAAELDERWDNRDAYARVEAERDEMAAARDSALAERDEWKKKYADRFFDSGDSSQGKINSRYKNEVKEESRELGYNALWNARI